MTPQASGLQKVPLALYPQEQKTWDWTNHRASTHTLLILYSYATRLQPVRSASYAALKTTYPHSICVCSLLPCLLSSFSLSSYALPVPLPAPSAPPSRLPLPPSPTPSHPSPLHLHSRPPSPSSFSSAPLPALSPNPILWYGVSKESRPSRSIVPSNYSNPHAICGSTTSMTAPSSHHLHVQ